MGQDYKKLLNKISNIPKEGNIDNELFDKYNKQFIDYISDDLNTANAISLLYDVIKNDELNGNTKLELIKSFDKVFSLDLINDNNAGIIEKGSISFEGINSKDQTLLNDILFLLKENLEDDTTGKTSKVYKYLYYFLQVLEDVPEIKYMLGYVAKTTGFISPDEFIFEEDEQFAFESIMYSAMVLYNSKSASKEKLLEMHKKFTKEIEAKHEEKLSRTQDLITDKDQALKELGYAELLEKIAEIQSRKI